MATTTIRVDLETKAVLAGLAEEAGESLIDTVRAAATALRRKRFAERVNVQIETLRQDPEAWADYLADAEATDVHDGLD